MDQSLLSVAGGTQIAVGLSAIVKVGGTTTSAYNIASTMKILSGGGTLTITPIPPALSGSSAAALIGTGYVVGSSEIMNFAGPVIYYLSAQGATMTVCIANGSTNGQVLI